MILFLAYDPKATPDDFGYILGMLDDRNPRRAREQLDSGYSFAGGWQPMLGFSMNKDGGLEYPGDPTLQPVAELQMRDERIVLYQHSVIAVIQKDGSFEVSRMD